ncbi:MAG: hypothetical protein IKX23_11425 [Treponema sp.]|nr:hypothetical protein [Treponema sp.]
MIILLAIIIWLYADYQQNLTDHEQKMRENNESLEKILERDRAQRMIEKQIALRDEYRLKTMQKSRKNGRQRITRTYAQDQDGRIIVQEIIEDI